MKKIILASASPRRRELLEQGNIEFEVYPSEIEEVIDKSSLPHEVVKELAFQKAEDVYAKNQEAIILGADTIVVSGDEILGKPKDRSEAMQMLKILSGKTHQVMTGVAIIGKGRKEVFVEKTDVTFWELSDEEIVHYIDSGECFDKAGSYGIQGLGALFVKEIKGDYYSVVGLPLSKTVRMLRTWV